MATIEETLKLPLALVGPVVLALVAAIGALWRQLIAERRDHSVEVIALRKENSDELEAEKKRSDESADVWQRQWTESLRQRGRDTELFLRSLGRRPPISSPPAASTPPT